MGFNSKKFRQAISGLRRFAFNRDGDAKELSKGLQEVNKFLSEEVSTKEYVEAKVIETEDVASKLAEIETDLDTKVDKIEGKGLSTNDYTNNEQSKVANLPADTNNELSNKADKTAQQKTGTDIVFFEDAVYGSPNAPLTGNITSFTESDNRIGVTVCIFHNDSSNPSVPASFQKMKSSENYKKDELNIFYVQYINQNFQIYSITQIQS